MNQVQMSLEEFRNYAKDFNVIPVSRQYLADSQTPLSLYKALAKDRPGTFLLESAEHGGAWSRYSFIGIKSASTLTEKDGKALWIGTVPSGAPSGIPPLDALKIAAKHLRSPHIAHLPPLTGGLVGYAGYDIVRHLEKIPALAAKDVELPEIAFMLTSDLAVFDHFDGTLTLIANAINWDGSADRVDEAYHDALTRLDALEVDLQTPQQGVVSHSLIVVKPKYKRDMSSDEYQRKVEILKEEIRAGEAFQVVLSQRFVMDATADPFEIYRALRATNPSPYMYLFRFNDGLSVVGSSPEALVKISGNDVMVHPIAGTRPRSADPDIDQRHSEELLADPKERAEHLMLVDLGRNDLGRVCAPGTVEVVEFMQIERYSHVMHIVSTVTGKLSEHSTPVDALLAVFPAGTLSGAPKPRAMEIIEENEPTRRGIYGGTIGYLDFRGNIDTCIAIRTAVIKDGKAYVQAGAGIVADSVPLTEDLECENKAAAVLGAIATANEIKLL
ncbi:MAG: anthranilate synthase component I [Actinomycetota bacterium]